MRTVLNAQFASPLPRMRLFAGTDATLFFDLVHAGDGNSLPNRVSTTILTKANYLGDYYSFPHLPVGTFEMGDVDTVYVNDYQTGPIVAIEVHHNIPGYASAFVIDWLLKRVVVTAQLTGETWIAEPNQWITNTASRIPLEPYQPNASRQIEYRVTVQTGDIGGAGTDGEIFIQLFGVDGVSSSILKLDDPNANDFEQDTVATYTVTSKDVGVLDRILLFLVPDESSPDWYCEEVVVRNTLTGQVWTFPVENWLGRGADGPLSVEVHVSK